jgi:hypothetical protein
MRQLITLFFLVLLPINAFSAIDCEYVGDDSYVIPDGEDECDLTDNSAAVALVIGGGLVYFIMNRNKDEATEEEQAEFIDDFITGKGIKIKKFQSGLSIYLLPNPYAQQKSFDHKIEFSNSSSNRSSNILTMEWNF